MRGRPLAFWLGAALVTSGVLLSIPMLAGARHDHYRLSGMPMDTWMVTGMVLIAVGLAATFAGLVPTVHRKQTTMHLEVLDTGRLSPAHLRMIALLIFAVAIDTQKPFTFTFILPGVAEEYGLGPAAHPAPGAWSVAWLPFCGIAGTTLGSLLWGYLGDRIGRRASLLYAALVFVGTSTCSTMPEFWQNMIMCGVMGLGAGGLLPIAYTLLAETVPTHRRGQVVVLVAGLGTAAGFLLTSWLADWLMPTFGWRIMWLVGLPSGLVLVVLSRYIPESPRFLLATGRDAQTRDVMRTFGMTAAPAPQAAPARAARLLHRPYRGLTSALVLCGLAWGFVNFGFLVWLPSNVRDADITGVLAKASLFAVPGALVVAWLYEKWSSKATMVAFAGVMAATLGVFAIGGTHAAHNTAALVLLVVVLLVSLWAVISVLSPYAAEVYPTRLRAAGSGVVAGASKLGGVVALGMTVFGIAAPELGRSALICAVAMLAATVAVGVAAIETRGRRLEEIAPQEPA